MIYCSFSGKASSILGTVGTEVKGTIGGSFENRTGVEYRLSMVVTVCESFKSIGIESCIKQFSIVKVLQFGVIVKFFRFSFSRRSDTS